MSGHSKWSKVKHQKEATDAAKGKIFTKLANAIIVAVKAGGGITDPVSNFKLRLAIDRARQFNMPKENIDRSIERASKAGKDEQLEEVIYEAFGPFGVGIIMSAATNNRQRTVAEIKNILERHGGVLVQSGAVSHLFRFVGIIEIEKGTKSFDDIMNMAMDLGAIDIKNEDGSKLVEIYTNPTDVHRVKEELIKLGVTVTSSEMIYQPVSYVDISEPNQINQIEKIVSLLDEHEDVQKVFVNAR